MGVKEPPPLFLYVFDCVNGFLIFVVVVYVFHRVFHRVITCFILLSVRRFISI